MEGNLWKFPGSGVLTILPFSRSSGCLKEDKPRWAVSSTTSLSLIPRTKQL